MQRPSRPLQRIRRSSDYGQTGQVQQQGSTFTGQHGLTSTGQQISPRRTARRNWPRRIVTTHFS
ncbi:MAG: hypothetical protein CMJ58_08670 [Planctomycetaceae bacterium]|nr:hypothetical protein [Planctomycetaceae bacterium]